ncbi:MAG TPA: metal-dependent hydrolase [Candidatus Sulfotelmatobacter sp.]|jgi:inner membrane protein|nr:metal-dependent hydrolase [Candidatus Sulfotelmatobacter sp.]
MPSVPTHLLVGAALGQGAGEKARSEGRFWFLALFCSALPDADVVGFRFGIHYSDLWGHRGLTHSILFGAVVGIAVGMLLGGTWVERVGQGFLLFLITCSHGMFDAMTNGGLGIAFFSPFDTTRYFFSWRPIQVSPIGAGWFFSTRGVNILLNGALIVWLPMLVVGFAIYGLRRWREAATRTETKDPYP